MSICTLSSREFNQDVSKAKREAVKGPVFITDRGHLAHVLLTIEAYRKITKKKESIIDLLAMDDAETIDFEAPKWNQALFKLADLS